MQRIGLSNKSLDDVCTVDKNAKPLGKGTFGIVYRARLKSGHKAAVKVIEKSKLQQMKVSTSIVATECEMMRECTGRQNFVQLYDVVESERKFCLILELCDGGNIQDGAMAAEGMLGESQVRLLMQQMVESIHYLHSKSICHRDIKPHNYLLVGDIRSSSIKVKLGDFGTALRLQRGQLLKDQVGTPAFMAPEIHLLPNKSAGYDHKVDVWAVGVCMIFLLANEYPFIDGQGRLMRQRIIQGDVPLWEANAFQSLFQGAQEVLGLVKKRPSRSARDLTRLLLAPRRQDRISAGRALQHDWFTRPTPEGTSLFDEADNLPLLDMRDFEESFSRMERDVGWAMEALGKVELGTVETVVHLDPNDDRIQSCVVCYGAPGDFGYVCPQCYHRVCLQCMQRLPKAICPHCRHEAADLALTHTFAQFARRTSEVAGEHSNKLFEAAAILSSDLPVLDVHTPIPRTAEDNVARHSCIACSKPASSSNYVCPACSVTMCFECTKQILVNYPQCPSCGEVERVSATVPQYVAAHEAWASAASIGDAITRSFSDFANFANRLSAGTSSSTSGAAPSRSTSKESNFPLGDVPPWDMHRADQRASREEHRTSQHSHGGGIHERPYLIAGTHQAHGSWSDFWGSIFGGSSSPQCNPKVQSVSFLSPTSACVSVPTDDDPSSSINIVHAGQSSSTW